MSYSIIPPVDYASLPDAMLDAVKAHCRIDFDDDDASLRSYTAQAISYAEKQWGFRVFGVQVAWLPEPVGASRYATPAWPISDFTVTAGGLDVSADYRLEMTSMTEPWWLVKIDGQAFPADASALLTLGYEDPETMDPAMLSAILRVTATLYEHRESINAYSLEQVPSWLNDMLSGLWIPRC
jgi:Phage gp6-like head-tail connector protein